MNRKKILSILLISSITVSTFLSGCGKDNLSAEDLTSGYANNETIEKIANGAITASEYAEDGIDYVTDENNINNAKQNAADLKNKSINWWDYWIAKIEICWNDFLATLIAPTSDFKGQTYDYNDLSEYDTLGEFKNPWLEAQGIDTSNQGTLTKQLKEFINKASEDTKNTAQAIKDNHDAKHSNNTSESSDETSAASSEQDTISQIILSLVPEYSGEPYVVINNNIPFFTADDYTYEPFEYYSPKDSLGRCGMAYANICKDIMPTEPRESIGQIKPSGFNQAKYDILKNEDNLQGYMWARCHLIGFQLAGENANDKNLITGSFYFNTIGMEPFENAVASYVRYYDRHVTYRVTPIYDGNNLVASGVLIEARSVEDDTISYCVFIYNVAPGIKINYADGSTSLL
ncbi:DNA/RNA non-specific endonuclease [Butyrivibrio hungatei]|uniref:DNA/RNA non-specific endonuclease n=1 Tax=Butyrivibrio hungatei TaxID=185008 RepID=A0A1D9P6M7_9FIRM|nr:DNA/RNA non-specific endonuclease [Butyrivibrio hungatei]AOZ97805.1 DNA/RNA non-specific endonuclease [Butyrivibrio hungatei]